jgi:autotransporter-associated beta strand protein
MAIESSIVNLNIGSANALGTGALQMSSGLGSNNQTVSNTSGGALALNNGLTFARAQTSQNANFTGSDMTFTGAVKLLNANNATTTLTVSNKLTLSGVVAHTGYTNGGLTKAGTGTLVLKGANTYAGPTTVSTGTLLVNNTTGSGTGTGAVSVTAGGTLGGTGTITPTGTNGITVASDAFLAPGASIGNLTANLGSTTGTLSLTSGAVFKFELGAANATIGTIAADSSDLLTIAGAGAGDVVFGGNNIDLLGTATGTGYYKLFDTSAGASTWTGLTLGASVDGGTLITGGLTTSNYGGGFSGDLILADGTFGTSAGDIYLNVVPEPSTFALLGAGVLALGWRARSRRQSAPGC